jgi:hypothetical protein
MGGTPSSLNESKNFSSTGLTSFLKSLVVEIMGGGFCGENRESIDASCFSTIKLKTTETRPFVSSNAKASRIVLLSLVSTPCFVCMMACISVTKDSLQRVQGLMSIAVAAGAVDDFGCFDMEAENTAYATDVGV